MSIALPEPVAAYFAAENREDADALARCFRDDGIVRDEGRTITGVAAIKRWNVEAREKYHHTVEPIDAIEQDRKTIVLCRVAGDFPNSPLNLKHIFAVEDGKIVSLEIR